MIAAAIRDGVAIEVVGSDVYHFNGAVPHIPVHGWCTGSVYVLCVTQSPSGYTH